VPTRWSRSDTPHLFRTGTALLNPCWQPAITLLVLAALAGIPCPAATPERLERIAVHAEPGAIGAMHGSQLGPRPESVCPDFVQPVEIRGPEGMLVSIETAAGWSPLRPAPYRMGLVVGEAYRIRVGGIERSEGREVFPSLRVLAKLATPAGQAWRFPIEVTIDPDDLRLALEGAHVRRVVYSACDAEQPDILPAAWFDVKPGHDALAVAGTLGDPVAEIVIGNRVPSGEAGR
jgi:hypothetical protein